MMPNIIDAIIHLISNTKFELRQYANSANRANDMGRALEEYIKDLFAGTVDENNTIVRNEIFSKVFSYLGNQNNPPDLMLLGGDAVEVKKIEADNSAIALNSSYPKAKLYSDSPMLSRMCKGCEDWHVKDMIYAIGIADKNRLRALAFVYGDDYCAEKSTYERIKNIIKKGVNNIHGVEFSDTNELGRVNRIDPLGITYLRVRGMWAIENPFNVFNYVYQRDFSKKFNFMCIINSEKYYSFDNYTLLEEACAGKNGAEIIDVKINNPNNPALLKKAKLIKFMI